MVTTHKVANDSSFEEVATRYKRGDEIKWLSTYATSKNKKPVAVGRFEGTLNGKIMVRYPVSSRYTMDKTTVVPHSAVILEDAVSIPVTDAG